MYRKWKLVMETGKQKLVKAPISNL